VGDAEPSARPGGEYKDGCDGGLALVGRGGGEGNEMLSLVSGDEGEDDVGMLAVADGAEDLLRVSQSAAAAAAATATAAAAAAPATADILSRAVYHPSRCRLRRSGRERERERGGGGTVSDARAASAAPLDSVQGVHNSDAHPSATDTWACTTQGVDAVRTAASVRVLSSATASTSRSARTAARDHDAVAHASAAGVTSDPPSAPSAPSASSAPLALLPNQSRLSVPTLPTVLTTLPRKLFRNDKEATAAWTLGLLFLSYCHASSAGFILPAMLPSISGDVQMTDAQVGTPKP